MDARNGGLGAGNLLVALIGVLCGTAVFAQQVYTYRDGDGLPGYGDRAVAGPRAIPVRDLPVPAEAGAVTLRERDSAGGLVLIAENTFFGPVQIAVYLERAGQAAGTLSLLGLHILAARSEMPIPRPERLSGAGGEYKLQYIPGDPAARHAPAQPYRLPYAVASRHTVSQAYPERITHTDPSSLHAIDFAMPVGTGVFAAREGVVMEVAGDYFGTQADPAREAAAANLVRLLHDDGTMALYAHLRWNSIRVMPGQRVDRGERIADSGNTGFSTGPHLHFVVQRNRGGAIVSVPVKFAGPAGAPITVASGDAPVAY